MRVAAGAIAGTQAMNMAVVVKMAQNALIGVVAFLLAMWSVFRKKEGAERPSLGEIWFRFPKFVVGFVVASLVFSLLLNETTATTITGVSKGLRGWWFALAFVSIGLETKIKDLVTMNGGRPALTFRRGTLLRRWTRGRGAPPRIPRSGAFERSRPGVRGRSGGGRAWSTAPGGRA